MNNKIKTYYIPTNPKIKKGPIYTLYINNNTNLDLSSISEDNNITLNNIINPFKENKIIIEEKDYNDILKINSKIEQLIIKISNNIKEETENINELNKLNIEYQNILKNFLNERKI